MGKLTNTQNKEIIRIVRDLSTEYSLQNLPTFEVETYAQGFGISPRMLKITFICYNFKQDETLANQMLISMIPESNIDELVVIFRKITVFSEEFIAYCTRYAKVKRLRPIITSILKHLRITCEDAHVYFFEDMSDTERQLCIKKLFATINTLEFKNTKDVILPIIDDHTDMLPELSEPGYKNLRQVGKIGLLRNHFSYFHSSETIRVEYLRGLDSFCDIFTFLRLNQLIYDPANMKLIEKLVEGKMDALSSDKALFPAYCDLLYNSIACKMCRSSDSRRRHLGAILLRAIFRHSPDLIDRSLMLDLIYDLSGEIRKLAEVFRGSVGFDTTTQLANLLIPESNVIGGAAILLRDINPRILVQELRRCVSAGDIVGFGLMYCLNQMNHTSEDLTEIMLEIYEKYKYFERGVHSDEFDSHTWNILRECCVYLGHIGRNDLLMDCLLAVDHLGLVCLLKDLTVTDSLDIMSFTSKGLQEIYRRETKARKSGGLSQYFVLLARGASNHDIIHSSLFAEIGIVDGAHIWLKDIEETVLFHILNVFVSLLDEESEDYTFYLKLGFACLDHTSFCIKNCGFVLLSSIFKKILIPLKTFDVFFLPRRDLRTYLAEVLRRSIASMNTYSIFFVLFIYRNTVELTSTEMDLITKCLDLGEFVTLMSRSILSGAACTEPLHEEEGAIEIDSGLPEAEVISTMLIHIKQRDERIKQTILKMYGLEDASFEYHIHQLARIARRSGCTDAVIRNLMKYKADNEKYNTTTVYNPSTDFEFEVDILNGQYLR